MKLLVVILVLANVAVLAAWQLSPDANSSTGWLNDDVANDMSGSYGGAADDLPDIRLVGETARTTIVQTAMDQAEQENVDVEAGQVPPASVDFGSTDNVQSQGSMGDVLAAVPAVVDQSIEAVSGQPLDDSAVDNADEGEPAVYTCYAIGPIYQDEKLAMLRAGLIESGRRIFMRSVTSERIDGYMVLMPASSSRAAAETQVEQLKAKGVVDSYIIPTGKNKNAVSLGVFKNIAAASKRWQAVKSVGFMPLLKPQKESVQAKWFDVDLPSGDTPQWIMAKQYNGVDVKARGCRNPS